MQIQDDRWLGEGDKREYEGCSADSVQDVGDMGKGKT